MKLISDVSPSNGISSNRQLAVNMGKSTVFGMVATTARAATRLITIPVIISHLGLGGYGIWSIIMVTAGYMRFGNSGIKSAFQKYVAEATGTGDFEAARVLISTGSITMLAFSISILIPMAFFSRTMAMISGIPQEYLRSAATAIAVFALATIIFNYGIAFDAVVMGGHRIDVIKKFNVFLATGEAVAIVALLHFGYAFVAMAVTLAVSELVYVFLCYFMSHRIVPQVRIKLAHFKLSAYPELLRFAGSYQLVSILETVYLAVVPLTLLRSFGTAAAGVGAVAGRLVGVALMAQDASVLPLLSGGAMVLGSRSAERVKAFLAKAFKATLAVSLPPLALVSVFGAKIVFVWTGQTSPLFRISVWLYALSSLFMVISLLQLVLYRASGGAVLDNVRQVLRIAVILIFAALAKTIGFAGFLSGMTVAEFVGMIFMFFVTSSTFQGFRARGLFRDALKVLTTTAAVVSAGILVSTLLPLPCTTAARWAAAVRLGVIGVTCLTATWPAIIVTDLLSRAERRAVLNCIIPRRRKILPAGS